MAEPQVAPYGSWRSPITSDLIVSEIIGLDQIAFDGEDLFWVEMRPAEGGRCVIVQQTSDGKTSDITPPGYNVRTRVHEYGGGGFVVYDGTVYFSNFHDQRLYRQDPGSEPHPITPEADFRYADGIIDHRRGRIICVREDHSNHEHEPSNTLVSLSLDGSGDMRVIASGNDFYSSPRLSSDGSRLAWLSWNHPNMPWDGTELWVSEMNADGSLDRMEKLAGDVDESVFQPEWSPDGILYFVSDRTRWWNLYRLRDGRVEHVTRMEAEFGLPHWVFGLSTYAFESTNRIICTYTRQGEWQLASLDTANDEIEMIETPYTDIKSIRATHGCVVFLGASSTEFTSIVRLDLDFRKTEVLRRASEIKIDQGYLSIPEPIEYPTEAGLAAHAFFYAPKNLEYRAPSIERPPLLVLTHGGPTAATNSALSLSIQYWTSRGIAVLDVNYGGSTGYGREYRRRLDGRWGIVDVDDCANGARYLVERGEVDKDRLAIKGGSAGGYTTLCALTFSKTFKAGASRYGVSDLEALAKETHKFESHYLDRLIGPYPERRDIYLERSPIHSVDKLSCPVIFLQGLEDEIVPPNQTEIMVDALRAKGIPVAYISFQGEQHGFRRAESIKLALDAELYFFSRIFGFQPADRVEEVLIENI